MAIRTAYRGSEELEEQHEINMTPFIDVMLVLLVVFMVAAPLATVSVPVDLPASSAKNAGAERELLFVTLQQDLSLTVQEQTITIASLGLRLDAITERNRDERVFLRADQGIPYREVMAVMNALADAGYTKVALVGLERPSP